MNKLEEQNLLARALSRNPRLRAVIESLQLPDAPRFGFPKEFTSLLLLSEEYPHLFEDVDLLDVYLRYQECLETGDLTSALAPIIEAAPPGYRHAMAVLAGTVAAE